MCRWKKSNKLLLFLPVIYFVGVFESPRPHHSSPDLLSREPAGHHAPAPAAQGWNHPSPHAIDGRYMPAHPHFLSAPQGARINFFLPV